MGGEKYLFIKLFYQVINMTSVIGIICIMIAGLSLLFVYNPTLANPHKKLFTNSSVHSSGWRFVRYHPSKFELHWMVHATEWQNIKLLCAKITEQKTEINTWLEHINTTRDVFSRFEYKHVDGRTHFSAIEPLAVSLRHPRAFCNADGSPFCHSFNSCRRHGEKKYPKAS